MLYLIAEGGPFAILTHAVGISALLWNTARLVTRGAFGSTRTVVGLSAAALCVGITGWGVGLHQAAHALSSASLEPAEAARMWRLAMGIAPIPLFSAAAWGALNAVLLCWTRSAKA